MISDWGAEVKTPMHLLARRSSNTVKLLMFPPAARGAASPLHVGCWHKADMLNALMNVRLWGQSGHGPTAALPNSIYEYTT